MEDREIGETLDREHRHDLARQARLAAREAAERLHVTRSDLRPVDVGVRSSKTNGRSYPLQGFQGSAEVEGSLTEALPWLLALSLAGGGQKRAMCFGAVDLWLAPD